MGLPADIKRRVLVVEVIIRREYGSPKTTYLCTTKNEKRFEHRCIYAPEQKRIREENHDGNECDAGGTKRQQKFRRSSGRKREVRQHSRGDAAESKATALLVGFVKTLGPVHEPRSTLPVFHGVYASISAENWELARAGRGKSLMVARSTIDLSLCFIVYAIILVETGS